MIEISLFQTGNHDHYTQYICLFREPHHVPSADTFHIPHNKFKSFEIEGRDRIECDIKEDKSPFEESVFRVR